MKSLFIATIFFTFVGAAETLSELRTRLVTSGLVISTGTPSDTGVAQAVIDSTGERLLSEMRLPVTITTDALGSQRRTTMLVLVYDLGQAGESAHMVDPETKNYTAPTPTKEAMLAGWLAGKAATGHTISWVGSHDLGVTTGIVVKLTDAEGGVFKRAVAVVQGAVLEIGAE